jgi:biopolymer transport protein ExbD
MLPSNIPTASMADIAFLLIIFFMVTTKFDVDRTRVTLPNSEIRSEVPKGSAYVVIHEDQTGNYAYKFSNGEDMSHDVPDLSALNADILSVAAADPTQPFVIKAEAETPYQRIDDAMELLRQAGVSDIVLLTDQRTIEDMQQGQ